MNKNPTMILAAIYAFKTLLRVDQNEYLKAYNDVRSEIEKPLSISEKSEAKDFLDSLSMPNNIGLFHMVLSTTIVGINENFDINADMPDLKNHLKSHMIVISNKNYNDIDLKYILRRLRNSVSHYNYSYDGNKFTFEDDNQSGTDFFKSEFTHKELVELIDEIAYFCVQNFSVK